MLFKFLALATLVLLAQARDVVITVGGNTTSNPGGVFAPQAVDVGQGDVLVFNFTQGNHSAIQSLFASPCIPAHDVNSTINGFNSGFRDAGNFTAPTTLRVVIDNNDTIWFYDENTCADGGVGGANINETGWETLDGFARNAARLNGSEATSAPSSSRTSSPTTATAGGSATQVAGANRAVHVGTAMVAPLLALAALSLSL